MEPEEKLSYNDAAKNIQALTSLPLPDEQPCIEALSVAVHYRTNFDTNFGDRAAYVCGVAKYVEEATVHADLNKLLEEGKTYAVMMYTWRCCSRSFPQAKSNDQENRLEINQHIVEVLEPGVTKLLNFMHFKKRAVERFCEEVKRLCHREKRNDFVSEAYLLTLGKFINMFAELDELKNMKASVRNDYSSYRRAKQSLNILGDQASIMESNNLSMFLATQNIIRDTLKDALQTVKGYEDLFADVIRICVHMYEHNMYIEPNEKYMLVKVMAFGLFMMDNAENSIYKMDQRRKINISRIDRILKQLEIVPLYGDWQVAPYQYIKNSVNFDASKWPCCESGHPSPQSDILADLDIIREEHMAYISKLSRYTNEATTAGCGNPRTDTENADLHEMALRGLQLLSSWTLHVTELYSWKLLNPVDSHSSKQCPPDAEEYERATRYNYSAAEKTAIVELIAMIKGLQLLMLRMEAVFMDAIRRHIYAQLQDFVQLVLREPIRKAIKKSHDYLKIILMAIRNTCADWAGAVEPIDDPAMLGKKDPNAGYFIKVPRRNVGPSTTQLYMVRTMLESLIEDGPNKSLRSHLDSKYVVAFKEFHKQSFYWSYLLNLNESLHNTCDLAPLWYREFFLEMTMGQRVQFPIEMSMPWILTDHILETMEPFMVEYLLYPLDLYNDSARYALTVFKQQFLYDEVEAEVNLCFDQFVYKLSDQIFAHYKHLAACMMLDKRYRSECKSLGIGISYPSAYRYETLFKQRHVQLLGRCIDLNKLVAQTINSVIQNSLDIAISRFEAGDITEIMELNGLLECNKLTHRLLKEFLPLDDFADMFREANQTVTAPCGRITLHVFWELNHDFLPNYCYNYSTNRFVKAEITLADPVQRDSAPHTTHNYLWGSKSLNWSFRQVYSMYSRFVGPPHFRVICRLLGYQDMAVVIEELMKIVEDKVRGPLLSFTQTLVTVMPNKCRLPRHDYGSSGVTDYYHHQLFEIIQFSDMRTEMFQLFREIGNAILFCLAMENALNQEEICDILHAAPFQDVIPKPHIHTKEGENREQVEEKLTVAMRSMEKKYQSLHVLKVIGKFGNKTQNNIVQSGNMLTKERLCMGLSMFESILKRIQSFFDNQTWHGPPPSNSAISVEDCVEFHRVWSAIQYVFCLPVKDSEFTVEALFGDSLSWGGCAIIVLLRQERRFLALDFCYHILEINRLDKHEETVEGIPLKKMIDRIKKYKLLNSQIFLVLDKYLRMGSRGKQRIHCFQPPVYNPETASVGNDNFHTSLSQRN